MSGRQRRGDPEVTWAKTVMQRSAQPSDLDGEHLRESGMPILKSPPCR